MYHVVLKNTTYAYSNIYVRQLRPPMYPKHINPRTLMYPPEPQKRLGFRRQGYIGGCETRHKCEYVYIVRAMHPAPLSPKTFWDSGEKDIWVTAITRHVCEYTYIVCAMCPSPWIPKPTSQPPAVQQRKFLHYFKKKIYFAMQYSCIWSQTGEGGGGGGEHTKWSDPALRRASIRWFNDCSAPCVHASVLENGLYLIIVKILSKMNDGLNCLLNTRCVRIVVYDTPHVIHNDMCSLKLGAP